MESELLTPVQIELMFKIYDFLELLSDEEKEELRSQLDDLELNDEELYIIKEEQDRLNEERRKRDEAQKYLNECDKQFNNIFKSSFIPGLEVGDTYFS